MAEEKVRRLMEELVNEAKAMKIGREYLVEMLDTYYYSKSENSEKNQKAKSIIKNMVAEMKFFSQTRRLFAVDFFYLAYEWQDREEYIRWEMARELARRNNMKETTSYNAIGNSLLSAIWYLEEKLPYVYYSYHKKIDCNKVLRDLVTEINTLLEERN